MHNNRKRVLFFSLLMVFLLACTCSPITQLVIPPTSNGQ